MRLVKEQLTWGTKSELKGEVLRGIKEIGSVLYWLGLLDIVLVSDLNSSFYNFIKDASMLVICFCFHNFFLIITQNLLGTSKM